MKLADLKKVSIRQHSRIHFKLRNGMECIIGEDGIAQVPGLHGVPNFNLEEELGAATEFLVEPVVALGQKNAPRPRNLKREELAAITGGAPAAAAANDHDDE
jgi:hypothetical protein